MFKVFGRQPLATPILYSRLCNEKAFYKFFIDVSFLSSYGLLSLIIQIRPTEPSLSMMQTFQICWNQNTTLHLIN